MAAERTVNHERFRLWTPPGLCDTRRWDLVCLAMTGDRGAIERAAFYMLENKQDFRAFMEHLPPEAELRKLARSQLEKDLHPGHIGALLLDRRSGEFAQLRRMLRDLREKETACQQP